MDSQTLQSSPEREHRAGYDGAKRKRGIKVHIPVDTPGQRSALRVMVANEQDRAQVATLVAQVQEVRGERVEITFVDQIYIGE